jgi:hypothetical protein
LLALHLGELELGGKAFQIVGEARKFLPGSFLVTEGVVLLDERLRLRCPNGPSSFEILRRSRLGVLVVCRGCFVLRPESAHPAVGRKQRLGPRLIFGGIKSEIARGFHSEILLAMDVFMEKNERQVEDPVEVLVGIEGIRLAVDGSQQPIVNGCVIDDRGLSRVLSQIALIEVAVLQRLGDLVGDCPPSALVRQIG